MSKAAIKKNKKNFLSILADEGINQKIIDAIKEVDEKIFFDMMFSEKIFLEPIPIGYGENSGNLRTFARMLNYLDLKENERVLEVGTGSGYTTAVLSLLSREVLTSEYHADLASFAKEKLYSHGFENIRFYAGDATESDNPFGTVDKGIIHCACKKRPLTVLQNIRTNGLLVFPLGPEFQQQITILKNRPDERSGEGFQTKFREQDVFSPIKGDFGYEKEEIPEEFYEFEEDDVKKVVENLPDESENLLEGFEKLS